MIKAFLIDDDWDCLADFNADFKEQGLEFIIPDGLKNCDPEKPLEEFIKECLNEAIIKVQNNEIDLLLIDNTFDNMKNKFTNQLEEQHQWLDVFLQNDEASVLNNKLVELSKVTKIFTFTAQHHQIRNFNQILSDIIKKNITNISKDDLQSYRFIDEIKQVMKGGNDE